MPTSTRIYHNAVLLCLSLLISGQMLAQGLKADDFLKKQPAPGFLENRGQVTDQDGLPRNDVKYIYDNHGFS